jgi:DNA-binding PadR family transcriptional regulator
MYSDQLRKLDELFEHSGDATVLLGLGLGHGMAAADGRPLHFSELVRTIVEFRGYVAEGKISRVLRRLQRRGLVAAHDENSRHPSYSLTSRGRQKTNLLLFVLETLENRDNPTPEDPDGPGRL